jgi:hypothetical protein
MMAVFLVVLVWTPISAAMSTLVLAALVRWYLVPLGFPDLPLLHLYGVALALAYVSNQAPSGDDSRDPMVIAGAAIAADVVRAVSVLAMGWLALQLAGGSM